MVATGVSDEPPPISAQPQRVPPVIAASKRCERIGAVPKSHHAIADFIAVTGAQGRMIRSG